MLLKLGKILIVLAGLAISIFFLATYLLYKPKLEGEIVLDGLRGEVKITRNKETGIPIVEAGDKLDALFGLGFLHAQDRLWQLEKMRRLSQGRLAEVFGPKVIHLDKLQRTLGLRRVAEQTAKNLTEKEKAILQAYCDGLNAYVSKISLTASDKTQRILPPEFYLLGLTKWEAWTIVDSLAILKLLNFNLTWNWNQDVMRDIFASYSPEMKEWIDDIVPWHKDNLYGDVTTILNDDDLKKMGLYSEKTLDEIRKEKLEKLNIKPNSFVGKEEKKVEKEQLEKVMEGLDLGDQQHSNNWVISGKHTASGKPLLASDPHLSHSLPSTWYLAGLKIGEENWHGATMAGIPSILIGHTNECSWGLTTNFMDTSDIWREKVEGNKYFLDGQWRSLEVVKENIKVKGQKDIELEVKLTHRGPIISDVLGSVNMIFGTKIPDMIEYRHYSLGWTGLIPKESMILIFDDLSEVKSGKEFFETINKRPYYSAQQHMVFACQNGDIAYQPIASVPKRNHEIPFNSLDVLDGTSSQFDWQPNNAVYRLDELPHVLNPEKGYIITANNRIVLDHVKHDAGATFMSTARAERIEEIIQKKIKKGVKMTVNDMIEIQQDVSDTMARRINYFIIPIARRNIELLEDKKDREKVLELVKVLHQHGWWGGMDMNRKEPTVYHVWIYEFYMSLFNDLLKSDTAIQALMQNYPFKDFLYYLLEATERDPKNTRYNKACAGGFNGEFKGEEKCAYNVLKSFVLAHEKIYKYFGSDQSQWSWGNWHTNEYPNMPWSAIAPLKPFFHQSVPTPGSQNTPNVSKFKWEEYDEKHRFLADFSAGYKLVVDHGKAEIEGFYTQDTGQQGNLLTYDGHYFDFNKRHLDGNLLPILKRPEEIKEKQVLTLKPKQKSQKQSKEEL